MNYNNEIGTKKVAAHLRQALHREFPDSGIRVRKTDAVAINVTWPVGFEEADRVREIAYQYRSDEGGVLDDGTLYKMPYVICQREW
ncbi:MAG: hypothetical protein LC114_19420 [Bryobacterales bacterium]|nr:hypothetical protein [Bryobacterales bacterium]